VGEMRNEYNNLVGKSERNRLLGRPGQRCRGLPGFQVINSALIYLCNTKQYRCGMPRKVFFCTVKVRPRHFSFPDACIVLQF
jgi:hypothetical protein